MDMSARIAEQKIRKAMEEGEFDNLGWDGKALNLEELSGVPETLRMGFKILKNAGVLPPEMELRKDIVGLQDLLKACTEDGERRRLEQQLTERMLRYNMMMERQFHKPAYRQYEAKIRRKLGL